MKTIDIIVNDKNETVELKVLSPLLKIRLAQIEKEYKEKANIIASTFLNTGEYVNFLTPEELIAFSNWNTFYSTLKIKSDSPEDLKKVLSKDDEKMKIMSELQAIVQPIYKKIQDLAFAEVEDEYYIAKLKCVIDDTKCSADCLELLKLDNDNDLWLIQPSEVLESVHKFFRSKR